MFDYLNYFYNYTQLIYYSWKYRNDKKYYTEKIINVIDRNQGILIKLIQWSLPRYVMIFGNDELSIKLNKYYDNCKIHNTSYTEDVYYESFNESIYEEYIINDILGSGSIGQVYKITNKKTKQEYAMKVLHPNINKEIKIFKIFYKIFLYYIKKKIRITDSEKIIEYFELQSNYINEAYNCIRINSMYNTELINIPNIHYFDNNIIIMDIIDMKKNDISYYKKYKSLILLLVFINNNCLNSFCHGDMHCGNWNIDYNEKKNQPIINIIDFGFCFKTEKEEYKIISNYVDDPYKLESIKNLICYFCKNDCDKIVDELYSMTDKTDSLEEHISKLFNIVIKYNISINVSMINILFIYYQLSPYFDFIIDTIHTDNNKLEISTNNLHLEFLNLCNYYKLENEYTKYLNESVNKESINYDKFKKYRNLIIQE